MKTPPNSDMLHFVTHMRDLVEQNAWQVKKNSLYAGEKEFCFKHISTFLCLWNHTASLDSTELLITPM